MKTQNKAVLIGYLGADPKIFETGKGHHYATFRLATDEFFEKDKEKVQKTTWHHVRIWGSEKIEFIRNNLMKGSHIMVEGMIDNYTQTDNTGATVERSEIRADQIINLDR